MQHDITNGFANDFGFFRLVGFLDTLNCGASTQTRLIAWYWRTAPSWIADDQDEFDAIAQKNLQAVAETIARNAQIVEGNTPAVNAGLKHSIPARLRSDKFLGYDRQGREKVSTTGLKEDAVQSTWVRLFQAKEVDGRVSNNAGRSSGRDIVRKQLREVPVSQLDLPDADPDDAAPADERDKVMPWDRVDLSRPNDLDDAVRRFLQNGQDDLRRRILSEFRDERPDDYDFIVNYVSRLGLTVRFRRGYIVPVSKRGAGFTQADRNRAKAIIDRLRRIERKAVEEGF